VSYQNNEEYKSNKTLTYYTLRFVAVRLLSLLLHSGPSPRLRLSISINSWPRPWASEASRRVGQMERF